MCYLCLRLFNKAFFYAQNYPDVGEVDFALELQSLVRSVVRIEKKVKDFIEKVNQTRSCGISKNFPETF